MKHLFALFGAILGAGTAALISLSWPSLIIGVGFGIFLGYFVAGLMTAGETILREDFAKLGTPTGRTLDEIVGVVGPYNTKATCRVPDKNNEPGSLYTWAKGNYIITLLFDENDVCLKVDYESGNNAQQ